MFSIKFIIKYYKNKPIKNKNNSIKFIVNRFKELKFLKIYHLLPKKSIFVVLKSPHVNKKSKEHFQYKQYRTCVSLQINNFIIFFNFLILFIKIFKTKNYIISILCKN